MKIRFVQTSDALRYSPLLEITSRSVIEYCRRHGHEYQSFLGIRQGAKPWHAALNRIPLLTEILATGFDGWIIYLDADAYVADLDFDLPAYLHATTDAAFIAAPSGGAPHVWWNINDGVFAANLAHPDAQAIVAGWQGKLDGIAAEVLAGETAWSEVIDDQTALHDVLKENPHIEGAVRHDPQIFNWDARFIRQIVRGAGSLELRAAKLGEEVGKAMAGDETPVVAADLGRSAVLEAYNAFAQAIYRSILLREPDALGFSTVVHMLGDGSRSFQSELEACFSSPEFAEKLPQFIERYVSEDAARSLARKMGERFQEIVA